MHLADPHHVHHGEQVLQFDLGAGFFHRLADGAIGQRLAQFHEAGRQRPEAVAWLDRPLAQQHLLAPHRHGADHVERVLVVDGLAGGANGTLAVVVSGDDVGHGGAALTTVFDSAQF